MPKKMTREEFISKAVKVHGNKYDYSKIEYVNSTTKIEITCKEHGSCWQKPSGHLIGYGCSKCYGNAKKTTSQFVKEAKEVHGDKYNYDKAEYKNALGKVIVICPEHGEFEQEAKSHLKGAGCKHCRNTREYSNEKFIELSNNYYNNLYDYSKTEYKGSHEKIIATCKKHGDFEVLAYQHLQGAGCQKCSSENNISKNEKDINDFIVEECGFKTIQTSRDIIPPLELDIYIPEKKIAIEYHGLYWHSEKRLRGVNPKIYHLNKLILSIQKNIRLIQIFEDEYIYKKEIVLNRLKHMLGIYERKIGGRQVFIKEISSEEKNDFLNTYHIQGKDNSSIKLGAFLNDELISVMTFGKTRIALGNKTEGFELIRFATKFGVLGQGIASKLFNHFVKNYNPKNIITYSDKRWNTGNLYKQLGFEYSHTSNPNYWYIIKNKRLHRFGFRKSVLNERLNFFNPKLTEGENMLNNGYDRIWDCGNDVYIYTKQTGC